MNNSFQNQTIWLTGASSGIGQALAEQLLQQGAQVIATVRNRQKMANLQQAWPEKLVIIDCDLGNEDDLARLPLAISGVCQNIDALVLSAGVCEYVDKATELDIRMFRRVMEVNFFAAVRCCEIAMPFLQKSAKPLILGVSSLSTKNAFTRAEAYGSSKAALDYFLNSLHIDLKGKIDVCIASPGFVKTPMTDKNDFSMPFLIEPERAAQEILTAMEKRPRVHSFPRRLDYLLGLLGFIPAVWYKLLAPAMKKNSASEST